MIAFIIIFIIIIIIINNYLFTHPRICMYLSMYTNIFFVSMYSLYPCMCMHACIYVSRYVCMHVYLLPANAHLNSDKSWFSNRSVQHLQVESFFGPSTIPAAKLCCWGDRKSTLPSSFSSSHADQLLNWPTWNIRLHCWKPSYCAQFKQISCKI